MTSEQHISDAALEACPFCGGPAKAPIHYNGTWETGCAGPHECPGTDVLVPLAAWNHRSQPTQPMAMTEAMVERAAMALYDNDGAWARELPWAKLLKSEADSYRELARTVLLALSMDQGIDATKAALIADLDRRAEYLKTPGMSHDRERTVALLERASAYLLSGAGQ